MNKALRHAKKASIGIVGGVIVLIGIIAIPYPGPGWLIVFAGLAILATEFEWAQRLLDRVRGKYDAWADWIKAQSLPIKSLFVLLTTAVVVTTLWLMNGYGIMNDALNLGWDWLRSPFVR
ncbi:MAG TPA: TIGR02611 family protein [Candidatus Saccharimonadales bacterium]|jgi:uncharacterized protein (TIGR02611 family)|nr:TIGR02611 family protein [Candidatus Saccharimonadales bacterium]